MFLFILMNEPNLVKFPNESGCEMSGWSDYDKLVQKYDTDRKRDKSKTVGTL